VVDVNAEQPASGAKMQQVSLGTMYGDGGQHQCFASASFASAPGAVSWKMQHAAVDVDSAYTDISGATSSQVGGDNITFSTNLPFVRRVITTGPGVNMTGRIGKRS
jgi:hypothetical protein